MERFLEHLDVEVVPDCPERRNNAYLRALHQRPLRRGRFEADDTALIPLAMLDNKRSRVEVDVLRLKS
jgi:hypothetical protein